jgi:4-aminobutyrate aminotransferase-like enzyme
LNTEELLERRARVMGPAYRLFYQEPLQLVRGEGVWLYDGDGHQYLDCYNNVASVGHCHPNVVEALAKQASTLNTHTRYLHENIIRYAERLGATLPGDLEVCMFTCTGTEANDLAFRIARTVTAQQGAIVTERAYHGNSMVVTELSTEDYPATEQPAYLETIEVPDPYRGRFQYGEADLGLKYAGLVDTAIESMTERGFPPAMFMCDNIFSSNGIQTPPPEYLQEVYRRVRSAGGLVVADEIQSGLCRLGDHTWGFEDSAVIPDIVTMGKPIGDGHPMAVVVTTAEIAEKFTDKYHYFNTFGGNPVSAAVGLAVLDVIEQESILQNVHDVGIYLREGLQSLASQYDLIGDIRGKGLFYGVELVCDRKLKQPAEKQATAIREYLRNNGVLLGTTGALGNVIKIRPPMIFSRPDVDLLLVRLEQAIKQL